MRKFIAQLMLVQLLAAGLSLGPCLIGQDATKPLTNADIVKMVKGGVRESVILSSIQTLPAKYNLSAQSVSALRRAGVSKKILDAMSAKQEGPSGQASAVAMAASGSAAPQATKSRRRSPTVTLLDEGRTQDLARERTLLAQTKTKPASMSKLASDSVLGQAFQGGMNTATQEAMSNIRSSAGSSAVGEAATIFNGALSRRKPATTYIWAVPNPNSANVLQGDQPSFTIDFSRALNVKADDFTPELIKLTPAPTGQYTCRLVGATQGKEDALSSFAVDWQIYSQFMEDRVPAQTQKLAPGRFKLSVTSPLEPGEYGVVLRPVNKGKRFSGGDIERNQGEGLLFNSVWSFQVTDED